MLKKLFNFKNKVILITGCNGQIGQAIVNLFLKLGSKVYGIDITKPISKSTSPSSYLKE